MIQRPFTDGFFWDEEPDPDSSSLDPWGDDLSDHSNLSPHSPDDWKWEEWEDVTVFLPIGLEPNYRYPLILWLNCTELAGPVLRDWFPDLSDRNYVGAEVHLPLQASFDVVTQYVDNALREISTFYNIHPRHIWVAGSGVTGEWAARLVRETSLSVTGVVLVAPNTATISDVCFDGHWPSEYDLYLAFTGDLEMATREAIDVAICNSSVHCRITHWDSLVSDRLRICSDLNVWLMQQVCLPASGDAQ